MSMSMSMNCIQTKNLPGGDKENRFEDPFMSFGRVKEMMAREKLESNMKIGSINAEIISCKATLSELLNTEFEYDVQLIDVESKLKKYEAVKSKFPQSISDGNVVSHTRGSTISSFNWIKRGSTSSHKHDDVAVKRNDSTKRKGSFLKNILQ